ncbi:hypothetical protein Pla144_40380 [Bythopirellula polymerisocia]|uniref:Uncharacterized protein n=1 Tax=Bythopirellula polymerisocia TaxID=2528003 RepID=A0A5C6CE89_9BACT|nr:hypothetical protein Pla144_40380 [Bythopirellula polymerisocia]
MNALIVIPMQMGNLLPANANRTGKPNYSYSPIPKFLPFLLPC